MCCQGDFLSIFFLLLFIHSPLFQRSALGCQDVGRAWLPLRCSSSYHLHLVTDRVLLVQPHIFYLSSYHRHLVTDKLFAGKHFILQTEILPSVSRSVEPQGTATNRTNLNPSLAQTPAGAHSAQGAQGASAHPNIPTHAPAQELPPKLPFHTTERGEDSVGGRGSPGSPAGSASYHSASDSANSNSAAGSASIHHPAASDGMHQHQAPLTEQLQSRLVQLNESLYKAPIRALYTMVHHSI